MRALLLVFLLAFCGAATPQDDSTGVVTNTDGSMTITLTPAQAADCVAGGGCMVVPRAVLREAVQTIVRDACGKEI